jgi:hypothetical protein
MLESMRLVSSDLYLEIKIVEAARIAWAAILIKTRQLILFDGAGFGVLSLARNGASGREWTQDGPQSGLQFLKIFWGRTGQSVSLIAHIAYISVIR